MPTPRILITGFGLVTPLGHSAWETFSALLAGRTIADRCGELPVDISPVDLVRAIGSVSFAQHSPCDPAVDLAERAGREALLMAGVNDNEVPTIPTIIATSKGAVHALTAAANQHQPLAASRSHPRPQDIPPLRLRDAHLAVTLGPHGYLTHHLRNRLKLGTTHHLVAACASSLIALHRARLALLHGAAKPDGESASRRGTGGQHPRILILTADAALLPSFIHAYQRLGVLAPLTREGYRGRPLDRGACGFMIAQAGAAIVLERIDDPGYIPPRHAVELLDSAEACDAFDLIRTDPAMPALRRIAGDLLRDRAIDLIHPHATGTAGETPHDACELNAIQSPISDLKSEISDSRSVADLYAHKGALGHTLGASGLISTILACLCARAGRRPPMPWLIDPIARAADGPARAATIEREAPPRPIRTQAVFAAGFGGHTAGVVLRSLR